MCVVGVAVLHDPATLPKSKLQNTSACFTSLIFLDEHSTSPCVSAILSHLKNAGLEADRKEAKQRYIENMQAYTTNLLGRPLEKLHVSELKM